MPRNETPEEKARWAAYMREYRSRNRDEQPDRELAPTERQLEILRYYADPTLGGNERAVAQALGISVSAVHNQMQRLKKWLHVTDAAQAVMKLWVTNATTQKVPEPLGQRTTAIQGQRTNLPARKARGTRAAKPR